MFRLYLFFFSSRRRHTRFDCDWSSDVCSSDLAGRDREIRLRPSLTALLPGSVPIRFLGGRDRNRSAFGSSFLSRQELKAPFEAVLLESLGPLSVIKRIVRVQPVAFRVHFQVRDLGNLVVLDKKLPLGN